MSKRKCVVPSCGYRVDKTEEKRSMFQCPRDEEKARRWAESIPGLRVLLPYHCICEIHFQPFEVFRYAGKVTNSTKSRLAVNAVPSIFPGCEVNYSNESAAQYASNSLIYNEPMDYNQLQRQYQSNYNFQHHTQPKSAETSLGDVIKDLSASENILMQIKQEELQQEIKMENLETPEVKMDSDSEMELTVYEQLQDHLDYYSALLPKFWKITELKLDKEEVIALSKECTVSDNQALVVMYEKSIVLSKSANLLFSVHGKTLNVTETDIPSTVENVNSLLDVVSKFDDLKVCQGICTVEFEVDKDSVIHKDDLNICRHVDCVLITDAQQCNPCYEYSLYLSSIIMNTNSMLGDQVCYNNNLMY